MTEHHAGGATAGPAVDLSRPASELNEGHLDAALGAWMGRPIVWSASNATGSISVGSGTYDRALELCEEYAERHGEPFHPEPWLDYRRCRGFISHDGAAALRAHIRSLGEEACEDFWMQLERDLWRASGQRVYPTRFHLMDATPRQQADAAYTAFLHQPPTTT